MGCFTNNCSRICLCDCQNWIFSVFRRLYRTNNGSLFYIIEINNNTHTQAYINFCEALHYCCIQQLSECWFRILFPYEHILYRIIKLQQKDVGVSRFNGYGLGSDFIQYPANCIPLQLMVLLFSWTFQINNVFFVCVISNRDEKWTPFNGELKRYFDQPFDQTSHFAFWVIKSLFAVKTTMNSLTKKILVVNSFKVMMGKIWF